MKKIISFILGTLVALNLSISVANAAAKEVRVAYFLEWPSPNLEDMQKKAFSYKPLTLSSWFGVGHSRKNATLTSFAAEFATEIERFRATIEPRIKLNIFFIIILLLI